MTRFNRVASVEIGLRNANFSGYIGTIKLSNLRTAFSVQKNLAWSANTASVKIWNLSQEKRNRIKDYGDQVIVSAGYSEDAGEQLLFIGNTTQVSHAYEQPEIITTLDCGDGERILNQKHISVSFKEKVPVRQVIETIAQQMELTISEFTPTDNVVYEQGFEYIGMGKNAIDKTVARLGLKWSVQNGKLQIIPLFGTTSKPAVEINADTGMIGIPQRFTDKRAALYLGGPKTGYIVTTTLRPDILPGDLINVKSQRIGLDGPYSVYSIKHEGDTFGPNWRSTMEIILI
ncbi:hypothetical protein BN1013_02395 [Candidatus Rubidus massiliensis]|nr:hypothetical protein BN1013_02395 [Candidatus Rubidus massiliensis]